MHLKLILSGGGTAGHINPALAIAREMKDKHNAEVLFIGTPGGMENRLVKAEGFSIQHVDVEGLRRKLTPHNIRVAWKYLTSVGRAKKLLRAFSPDVVVGTGGYVCAPVLKAAAKLKIPTIVHEQNVIPGVTVKMLAKTADKVAISFAETTRYLPPEVCALTGNPLRPELFAHNSSAARKSLGLDSRPYVVVFGGSLGAERLNEAMIQLITKADLSGIQLCWGTGERHYEEIMAQIPRLRQGANIDIRPYIKNMGEVMSAADLLICRAGAITVSEICALGKASILIPSPNVAHNHQEYNARALADKGACRLLLEPELSWQRLKKDIWELTSDPAALNDMRRAAQKLGKTDATQRICGIIEELAQTRGKTR